LDFSIRASFVGEYTSSDTAAIEPTTATSNATTAANEYTRSLGAGGSAQGAIKSEDGAEGSSAVNDALRLGKDSLGHPPILARY
jgi:hypothetical protein